MVARAAPPKGLAARVAGLKKRLGAWFIDLEYRLRVSRPFTFGAGARHDGAASGPKPQRVFFPGCSLPAADPELVLRTHAWLRERDPEVALWSDCCGMPLEKFSTPEAAARGRERTRRLLQEAGTVEIITACGNCSLQFDALRVPGLRVTSLYGLLAEAPLGDLPRPAPAVVHHPCSARVDKEQQKHFRALADRIHLTVVNADDAKHPLPCCLVKSPGALNKRKALADQRLVTYCAHCTMDFGADIPTRHILQEIFGSPGDHWSQRGKVGRFLQYFRLARGAARRLFGRPAEPARLPERAP